MIFGGVHVPVIIGFVIFMMLLLTCYSIYRLIRKKDALTLAALCLQLFSTTMAVFGFIGQVQPTEAIQAAYIILGIVLPSVFLLFDYFNMITRVKEQGSFEGLVQPVLKETLREGSRDPDKSIPGPLLKDFPASRVSKALKPDPADVAKCVKTLLSQAQACAARKEFGTAYEIYNVVVKLIRNSPELFYNYGNICFRMGYYRDSIKSYDKFIKLVQKREAGCESMEGIDDGGVPAQGNEAVDAALKDEPGISVASALYNMGNAYYVLKRYETAADFFNRASGIRPEFKEADESILNCYISMGETRKAIEHFEKIPEKSGLNQTTVLMLSKMYSGAAQDEKALKLLFDHVKQFPSAVSCYEEIGRLLVSCGRYEEAVDTYKRVVELNPREQNGYYSLGLAYYRTGMKEKSVECFRKAICIKPDSYRSYYNLAVVLEEMNQEDEAASIFRKVTELAPDFVDAYNNLGILLSTTGRHAEAVRVYLKGIERNPDDYSLYFNMGITLSEQGKCHEASEAFRNALKLKPDEHEIYCHLGMALTGLRRYDEAVEAYKTALRGNTSKGEVLYNLSSVYALLRKHDIAIESLRKAMEIDSGFKVEARRDRSFDTIRSNPGFKELVG
jgi:tetratricopeptide (TPR) repeat protein